MSPNQTDARSRDERSAGSLDQQPFSRERTSPHEVIAREVATSLGVDVRTVRREIAFPGIVRGVRGVRIRAALASLIPA